MKKKNILLALSSLLFLFAGCSDDDIVQQPSAVAGQEVEFGVAANPMKTTRTVYTGTITGDKDNGRYEGVNWVSTDKVRLFSSQSANTHFADYGLNLSASAPSVFETSSGLVKLGTAGLQWGDGLTEHVFYGVYPSPSQFLLEGVMDENKMLKSSHTFQGYIPMNQHAENVAGSATSIVAAPNMDYAYMGAKTVVSPANIGKAVSLVFAPFVTTLELSFVNKTEASIPLTSVMVSSVNNKTPIHGKFDADLSVMQTDGSGKVISYPKVTDVKDQSANRSTIVFSFFKEGGVSSVTVDPGAKVTLTVFMNIQQPLNDIDVTLQSGAGFKKGHITGVTILPNKKNYIHNIPMRGNFDISNWITHLPDNALIRGLSIPGAGGVCSDLLSDTSNPKSKQQTLTIEELWQRGIRAFEFSVDRNTSSGKPTGKDFGGQRVICNGIETSMTLAQAVGKVLEKLSYERGEFVMFIINYQPKSTRYADGWMRQFKEFWGNVETGLSKYNADSQKIPLATMMYDPSREKDITVKDARGKVFCIARPTSVGEENSLTVTPENVHDNILVINGWGSLKDKWEARGYTAEKTYGPGLAADGKPNRPFFYNTYFLSKPVGGVFDANLTDLKPDFHYNIQAGSLPVEENRAWVQEWARVSNLTEVIDKKSVFLIDNVYSYWAPTLQEKKDNIDLTFRKAMQVQQTQGDLTSIYINSLCGYYVDPAIEKSFTPYNGTDGGLGGDRDGGIHGNVVAFARDINTYVYNSLFKNGLNDVTGPLGIVLMDRVGTVDPEAPEASKANSNLPYLIISNNFRFDMELSTKESTSRSVDAQSAEHYDFIFDASANK